MRTSEPQIPVAPRPYPSSRSSSSTRFAPRRVRWNSAEVPTAPPPTTIASNPGIRPLLLLLLLLLQRLRVAPLWIAPLPIERDQLRQPAPQAVHGQRASGEAGR